MSLVIPHIDEVRLQQSDLIERRCIAIPELFALVELRLLPKDGGSKTAKA